MAANKAPVACAAYIPRRSRVSEGMAAADMRMICFRFTTSAKQMIIRSHKRTRRLQFRIPAKIHQPARTADSIRAVMRDKGASVTRCQQRLELWELFTSLPLTVGAHCGESARRALTAPAVTP